MSLLLYSKRWAKAFVHLIYPPICVHCRDGVYDPQQLLCTTCLSLLSLIDSQERCPICFSSEYARESGKCSDCTKGKFLLHRCAAAFDYEGPAATLVKQFKYSNKPYFAQLLASYQVAQFCFLEWPKPDLIVPVPMPWTHLINRGYNQSALLAIEVARLLDSEYCNVLQRSAGAYSQAGLSVEQRKQLTKATFSMAKGTEIYGKKILLIDDVMTTGSTLQRCAEILLSGYPHSVYGMTVCKAL